MSASEFHQHLTPYASLSIASAVLAGGYRKRRTLTTLEEIHASDLGTVLLAPQSDAYPVQLCDKGWQLAGNPVVWTPNASWLPATVLFDPSEETQ